MARRPLELELRGGVTPRQRIWDSIRARTAFSQAEVQADTLIHWDTVASYVQGLVNAGFVRVATGPDCRANARYVAWRYELMKDVGAIAPRVAKDGQSARGPSGGQALWTAMRVLRRFSLPSLLQACAEPRPTEATAKTYVARLVGAGYLRAQIVSKGTYGRGPNLYCLLRDTGPLCPAIKRDKSVLDRNV